jgi:predicted Zn-dependent protease
MASGIPEAAHADPFKPGKTDQIKLGKRVAQDIRKKEKVMPGSDPMVRTMRRVAQRLLSNLPGQKEPWEYSFDVIDSKELNAFALPGGPIFFYRGLIEKMKTEDELAGVLAHEIVHVRKEHWAYQYRDQQKRNLALTLGGLVFGVDRDVLDLAALGSEIFVGLRYSRRHETEADDLGYTNMVAAGYNPQGMVDLFSMLEKESKGQKPPEWLSTHPAERNRVDRIRKRMKESKTSFPAMRPLVFSKDWNPAPAKRTSEAPLASAGTPSR